jgi:hypothetical protein
MITKEDLDMLKQTLSFNLNDLSNNKTWQMAFSEYNSDKKDQLFKPLSMGCRPCYYKVYSYLHGKVYLK